MRLISLVLLSSATAFANVTTVSQSLTQVADAPRWMFDPTLKIKGGPLVVQMVEAKRASLAKDRPKCLSALKKSYALGKSLGPWLVWNQLQCALIRDKGNQVAAPAIIDAIRRLEAEPRWFSFGPSAPLLRTAYTAALVALTEQQIKTDRRSAWVTLDKLLGVRGWLTLDERASAYRWAGELAFIEQNLTAAADFLQRSLNERDSGELRARVESIRSTLLGKAKGAPSAAVGGTAADRARAEDPGLTDEEKEIYARMKRSLDAQDFVPAIEDAIALITKYPGSRRAIEAADRVLEVYVGVAQKTDDNFRHVREAVVKQMLKADAGRLYRWGANAFARGVYEDAQKLAEAAYAKYDGQVESTRALLLAAKGAQAAGNVGDARKLFENLLKQHGGTNEAAEGTFRLGLLEFRAKRYAPAAALFERTLALRQAREYEYRALYWQWRAQQQIDAAKAASFAEPLITRYPLSYYGLRAKAELNGGVLELPDGKVNVRVDLRLLENERLAWERFNVLLKAGWLKEAERELESLPDPQSNDERLLRARFWAAILRYDHAIGQVNKAIDNDPALLQASLLKMIFPQEYSSYIARESRATGVNESWLLALIRQESSFRPEAKSPANAAGVMQLLPSTAAELAREFKLKDYSAESLSDPDVNIKLGATYLSRLLKSFSGNYPLALAAYNAGPTRLRRWLNARKDLSVVESSRSSGPDVEVWIDELPWDETSLYVKSILRNWLIYQLLGGSKLTLSEPIWVDAKTTSR